MKILWFLVVILVLPPSAWADTTATGTGTAEVNITQDFSDKSVSTVTTSEKRPHLSVAPGTGTFLFPPVVLDGGGWQTLLYDPLFKVFKIEELLEIKVKNMGIWRSLTENYLKKTVYTSRVNKMPKYWESAYRLDWYPTGNPLVGEVIHPGDEILGEYEIDGQKEWTSHASLLLGILHAMEETYCRRVVVQYRLKKIGYNAGFSIGSGVAAGATMGPATSADDKAGIIALGGLMGKTWAGVWSMFDFRILALNAGPTEPPANWWKFVKKPEVPPLKPEAAPPAAPPAEKEKCEAEKKKIKELEKELDGHRDMIREASEKLAKAEKEKIIIPPPCPVSIEFDWDKWTIRPDQQKNLEEMAQYLVQFAAAVKKLGGKFTLIGHADETVAKELNSPDKDYVNPRLGLQRSRSSKASLEPYVIKAGGTVEQVVGIAPVSAGRDTPVITNAGKEPKNRHVYLVIVTPDIRGHNEPK